ncbi:hypothetical protein MD484_g4780, partial [Candolleomyces efflorescens]
MPPSSMTPEAHPRNPFVNMGTPSRRSSTTIASGLGLQHPTASITRARTPNSKLSVKRTSVSPSLDPPKPLLTPPRSTARKSTANGSAYPRATTPVKWETAARQHGQPSSLIKRESTAVSSVKRKQTPRSTAQVDDPFALMGNDFAGMDTSRFVKGTSANKEATGKSKDEAIYIISDSESDDESDPSIVEYVPQETPTKPRQASRLVSTPIKQGSVPPFDIGGSASFLWFEGYQIAFPLCSWLCATHAPSKREKGGGHEHVPIFTAISEQWATDTYAARKGREGSRGGKGKEVEEEVVLLPSPPPSIPKPRVRRSEQQPATPRTPTRLTGNSATFGPGRLPANANPQPPPKVFLPIPIIGIPGLHYTLDEFDTVYNPETGERQYKLPNGELLKAYQTTDVDLEMTASMYRHCLRVEKGKGNPVQHDPDELVQGILLNYQMGLGKTHVASVLIDRGRVHRKKINESLGVPDLPLKQDLIIAPLSTHNHWEEHLTRLSEGRLTVKIWVPGRRAFDPQVDVYIITIESFRNHHNRFGTYQDMIDERHELNPAENPKRDWSLGLTEDDMAWVMSEAPFAVTEFNTIVVDESHYARNSASLGARSLLSAHADNFLLLTGTPAQNTLDDLQINFALMVHRSKRHDFREAEKLNRKLNKDRKERDEKARSLPMHVEDVLGTKLNGAKEIEHFMKGCIVTRTFECPEKGIVLVQLPKLHRVRVEVLQTPQEKRLRRYIADLTACDMPLVRILRQRQVVLHGNLVRKVILDKTSPRPVDVDTMDEDITEYFDVLPKDLRFLKVDSDAEIQRAIEATFDKREIPSELKGMGLDQLLEPKYISSKFKAIYAIMKKMRKGEKVIIFSVFTSLLDILGEFLEDNAVQFVQFDGRMDSRERAKALRSIANNPDVKAMLVSMKAGGVGLNITACNHVILFDPWWNPYVEEQAISRAHRIGQTRECYVYRLHSPDTVEDKVVNVAKEKRGPIEAFMARCAVLTNERDAAQKARTEGAPRGQWIDD